MEEKILLGTDILDSQLGNTILILDPTGENIARVQKIKKVHREDYIDKLDEDASGNYGKLARYILDYTSNDKYICKEATVDDLNIKLEDIDELMNTLGNVRKYILSKYPSEIPKETDIELIRKLRDVEGIHIYKTAKEIPQGREFDKHRELRKALNRVNKRNERFRKKGQTTLNVHPQPGQNVVVLQNTNNVAAPLELYNIINSFQSPKQIITSNGLIIEIIDETKTNIAPKSYPISEPTHAITSNSLVLEIGNDIGSNKLQVNNTSMQGLNNDVHIPEDIEIETDPLKVLTWPEYFITSKFAREYYYYTQMNWKEWDIVVYVYSKLSNINVEQFSNISMREQLLKSDIIEK